MISAPQPQSVAFSSLPQNPLPATFVRGGTSKGIFLNKANLPLDSSEWNPIFLGIMGSPDPYGRQLNGMGGGVSSLSKICVVGIPTPEQQAQGIQVQYTFVQVGIRDTTIDTSGNCGNLSSMIGAYAVDEGIVPRPQGEFKDGADQMTVRSFNTNTNKVVDTTFPVTPLGNPLLTLPQTTIAGVSGEGSQIVMEFINPAGARTGKLLPTGNPLDFQTIQDQQIPVSAVDATNPTVFVDYASLAKILPVDDYVKRDADATKIVSPVLEQIRQQCATSMGLDPNAQAQPKIALLSPPSPSPSLDADETVDIVIHPLSMGVLHQAVPMTVGLCLGAAALTPGTVAWKIVQKSRISKERKEAERGDTSSFVRIRHPGGLVDVGAGFGQDGRLNSAKVVRTGKFLMKGMVWW